MDVAFKVFGFSVKKNVSKCFCAIVYPLFMALRSHKTHAERSQNYCLNILIAQLSIPDWMLHSEFKVHFGLWNFSSILHFARLRGDFLSVVAHQIHTNLQRKLSQLTIMWRYFNGNLQPITLNRTIFKCMVQLFNTDFKWHRCCGCSTRWASVLINLPPFHSISFGVQTYNDLH